MLTQNKTIGDLTSDLANANTQITTLTAQFTSLLADVHARGGGDGGTATGTSTGTQGCDGDCSGRGNAWRGDHSRVSQYPVDNRNEAGQILKKGDFTSNGT